MFEIAFPDRENVADKIEAYEEHLVIAKQECSEIHKAELFDFINNKTLGVWDHIPSFDELCLAISKERFERDREIVFDRSIDVRVRGFILNDIGEICYPEWHHRLKLYGTPVTHEITLREISGKTNAELALILEQLRDQDRLISREILDFCCLRVGWSCVEPPYGDWNYEHCFTRLGVIPFSVDRLIQQLNC